MLDASAGVALLLNFNPQSDLIADRVLKNDVHVPHIFDLEVMQSIRRYLQRGDISNQVAESSIGNLIDLEMERHAPFPDIPRIWELRENLTAYDAAYIALAETMQCALLTTDVRLSRAPGIEAEVEVVR